MPHVVAVCCGAKKGTSKQMVPEGMLQEDYGLVGDGHAAAATDRQVSLLAVEHIEARRHAELDVQPGDFAENLTTEGIDLTALPVGTIVGVGQAVLQITQIGKECHSRCAIYHRIGECVMPREGVFARVVRAGRVKPGDRVAILQSATDGRTYNEGARWSGCTLVRVGEPEQVSSQEGGTGR